MSTWSNEQKSGGLGPFLFKIDDTFLFNIDNNYHLMIEPGGSQWQNQPEN